MFTSYLSYLHTSAIPEFDDFVLINLIQLSSMLVIIPFLFSSYVYQEFFAVFWSLKKIWTDRSSYFSGPLTAASVLCVASNAPCRTSCGASYSSSTVHLQPTEECDWGEHCSLRASHVRYSYTFFLWSSKQTPNIGCNTCEKDAFPAAQRDTVP